MNVLVWHNTWNLLLLDLSGPRTKDTTNARANLRVGGGGVAGASGAHYFVYDICVRPIKQV